MSKKPCCARRCYEKRTKRTGGGTDSRQQLDVTVLFLRSNISAVGQRISRRARARSSSAPERVEAGSGRIQTCSRMPEELGYNPLQHCGRKADRWPNCQKQHGSAVAAHTTIAKQHSG